MSVSPSPGWLDPAELRVGLGCMRLSTDEDRDEERALDTIAAAADAGVTVFDTAHAYGRGASERGHNESLLARALRRCGAHLTARIITKSGMTRARDGWVPDGRASTILADCESSLAALGGLAIDLMLIHAPDPRSPWQTSVRALSRLLDEGMVRRVGVSNVNRRQLDEALAIVDITAVQVALSVYDDSAVRGGIVERCAGAGIAVIAHSPLGGPRRARSLARHHALSEAAERRGATPAEVALAWLLDLSPAVVAIPGARRPDTARSAARAAALDLDTGDRAILAGSFGRPRPARHAPDRASGDAEVLVVMGIPGAGKSRVTDGYAARGYRRLNRDERGGSLRDLAEALDDELAAGARQVVMDNTYLTRAARSHVIETASLHGVPARCVWLDTPLAQAQVNLVARLLERFGFLPSPDEVRALARREPGILMPTSQMRALRELEPPDADEGFVAVERVSFERTPPVERLRPAVFVAASALASSAWIGGEHDPSAPHLVFDWSSDGSRDALDAGVARLSAEVSGLVEGALCPHGGGPPACWCRPPLPGLPLAFARAQRVDPSQSALIGTGSAHRTLASALGARYRQV